MKHFLPTLCFIFHTWTLHFCYLPQPASQLGLINRACRLRPACWSSLVELEYTLEKKEWKRMHTVEDGEKMKNEAEAFQFLSPCRSFTSMGLLG
ncbi:hypothetical protein B0H63DRAFT_23463 [Podospora didyma]|uniref:Secreted protein n=1 Tax=Podospora didyma TaxID=330526 RepID=A0AAE0U7U7_9PEZI|nr:hypothetical protein B0H63DRAFT_23463 [Podospora didyma]